MIGKLDDALRFNETALSLRAQRQQLLASNIANADTPNYKARDMDFSAALKAAVSGSGPGTPLAATAAAHIVNAQGGAAGAAGGPLLYRTIAQGNVDGNTVDMDVERNQFTDNAIRYEASLIAINSQIKGLLSVIQG